MTNSAHEHIGDIDNDALIYVDVRTFDNDAYMGERERISEVIELHVMSGDDLTYWYDRAQIVSDMQRDMQTATKLGDNNVG